MIRTWQYSFFKCLMWYEKAQLEKQHNLLSMRSGVPIEGCPFISLVVTTLSLQSQIICTSLIWMAQNTISFA